MGNTKQIFFEGLVKNDDSENPFFGDIEDQLIAVAHGDHASVKIIKTGYLHLDNGHSFVIGALTTHSMSGFEVIKYIIRHLKEYTIMARDADWGDVNIVESDWDNRPIQLVYEESTEEKRYFWGTSKKADNL